MEIMLDSAGNGDAQTVFGRALDSLPPELLLELALTDREREVLGEAIEFYWPGVDDHEQHLDSARTKLEAKEGE